MFYAFGSWTWEALVCLGYNCLSISHALVLWYRDKYTTGAIELSVNRYTVLSLLGLTALGLLVKCRSRWIQVGLKKDAKESHFPTKANIQGLEWGSDEKVSSNMGSFNGGGLHGRQPTSARTAGPVVPGGAGWID